MVHIIRTVASEQQISEMLETLESYIKLAVDVDREVLAGGGALHADCEAVLLENGSRQESIWGADWVPASKQVHYEALINLRPSQSNLSMRIENPELRERIGMIVRRIMEVS